MGGGVCGGLVWWVASCRHLHSSKSVFAHPPPISCYTLADLMHIISEIFGCNSAKVAKRLSDSSVKSAEDFGLLASSEEEVVSSILPAAKTG